MVVKLGRLDAQGRLSPDPVYGSQLSELAVQGIAPEGQMIVHWGRAHRVVSRMASARACVRRVSMRRILGYGPLTPGTLLSARLAPALVGVGLLEAIPDSTLLALADSADANGDGISGRLGQVPALRGEGRVPGRFGWKATQPSVEGQVTMALIGDIGITTPLRAHVEMSEPQRDAAARPTGGEPELDGRPLESLVNYCRTLAVPARRGADDPAILRGARRFEEVGCARCHVPTLTTGPVTPAALSGQTIHPYTDLLLHDMGTGLSDGMPEGDANAVEWRTPALWGIGLAARVGGQRFLLHDGRARSVEEAILWHGGEAGKSRDAFRSLPAAARNELLKFVESL
jgi:CxxC motif-containing protein (DUF1111 family)